MNVLYIAPRFHTNQVPVVKGWMKNGDNVKVLCQYSMPNEDYTVLSPIIAGYSGAFSVLLKIYQKVYGKKIANAQIPMKFNAQFGLPPMKKVKKIINEFQPDVVIYRDRSLYNIAIYKYCYRKGIKGILYNQTPYSEEAEKTDILHCLMRKAGPQVRMTPVLGINKENMEKKRGVYYVPFVVEPYIETAEKKQYFSENEVHILCVGKYEERKHHIELITEIAKLSCRNEIEVIHIGECSRPVHEAYKQRLENCIKQCGMDNQTRILTNLTLKEVYEEYMKADLFVLPSTGEFASISQLEAMSCALPVICSNTNGTADCVHEGKNGFLFHDKNFEDLRNKLELILTDKKHLMEMGRESYRIASEEYSFDNYKESIQKIMKEMND